jgi:pyruvate formate lyase activating enzyme
MEGQQKEQNNSGIVFDVKRYALHDGPGVRVTIHLKGCPLSCWWCHNPEGRSTAPQVLFRPERCISCGGCAGVCPSGARETCGKETTVDDVMERILKERIFFDQSGGGVTLGGGEPLFQPGFALSILKECRRHEIHTAVDTCGFVNRSVLMEALPLTGLFLYDLKHMDPEKHKEYTGVDNEVILSNLAALGEAGALIHARMPFIPDVNTDEKNLRSAGAFLRGAKGVARVHILPYHTAAEDKHRRWNLEYKLKGLRPPPEDALKRGAAILEGYGLKVEVGG